MKTLFPIAMVAAIFAASAFIYCIPSGGRATAAEPDLMPAGSDLPPPPQPAGETAGPAMPSDSGAAMPADAGAAPDNSEVLTRGPVHEAFATPLEVNPQPGPVIKKEPPPAIEEMPPDQKPDGDNVVWIPGYFDWDDDRQDFIWVSGVWRNVPPDQTWVAGYWSQVPEGYQWTPGFWTSAKKAEVNYLPAPPQSLEVGPNIPAPSENSFWVPGTWVYRDRYVWQPGFWTMMRPDWIWVPAHFVWTPGGYVFLPGYWDYTPQYRGCLFAPVVFSPGYYRRPVIYTPAVVINLGFFSANLFCRPAYSCYYFGDYYGVNYVGLGFRPWFSLSIGRGGYDPLCNYYRWRNSRTDPNWLAQSQRRFETLQKNPNDRPPRTFAAQEKLFASGGADRKPGFFAATTIQQAAKDPKDVGFKLHEVSLSGRQEAFKQAQGLNKISQERFTIEKGVGSDGVTGAQTAVLGQTNRSGGNNAALANRKLKLSTVTSMPSNDTSAGAGNLGRNKFLDSNGSQNKLGNQNANTGDANKGVSGNRFTKQFGNSGMLARTMRRELEINRDNLSTLRGRVKRISEIRRALIYRAAICSVAARSDRTRVFKARTIQRSSINIKFPAMHSGKAIRAWEISFLAHRGQGIKDYRGRGTRRPLFRNKAASKVWAVKAVAAHSERTIRSRRRRTITIAMIPTKRGIDRILARRARISAWSEAALLAASMWAESSIRKRLKPSAM